ncbi:MAG: OFA family MFS transporter, partial [Defluviitaleaceae bacterium]|nr:OFA family MFS transporter [Defluviitaleaceae bacterium]
VGGRIQDKIGPRKVLTVGGALVGIGLVIAGLVGNNFFGIVLSFGVVASSGMGLCYSSLSPPALKWFHPSKKGLISGLIVGGFGLSAVFYAPVATALLENFGIQNTFLILGVATFVICIAIAQIIKNPPAGYVPPTPENLKVSAKRAPAVDIAWREMLASRPFQLMFLMFLLVSSAGLMVIGNVVTIAQTQAGISDAAILAFLVSFLALTNTFGRVLGGIMSDKIGRINSLFVIFILQTVNMAAFAFYSSLPILVVGILLVGFCFGALLSVMPALCADTYGLKFFGQNYGILFMAWGFAGVLSPIIANRLFDATGSFNTAFTISAVTTGAMILANILLKRDIEASKA